jgi:undecaprenyl-diphosphatase
MLALLLHYGADAVPGVVHMLWVGAVCLLLYKWLKGKTLRPRPFQLNRDILVSVPPLDQYSFPSGHTLHAVAFTVVLLAHFPALAWLAVPFTALVALSRVVLGLHYPTDVLAGTLIGATVASVSFAI